MHTRGCSGDTDQEHNKTVIKTTITVLICNLILSSIKFLLGILGNSQTIVADAVHSLSDASTDVAIIVGVKFWSRPADDDHPHGHQKIETLIVLGIGILLGITAIGIVWNAISKLKSGESEPPQMIALYAALLSIVVKEVLYRWNIKIGRRIKSEPMIANAWHQRSDAMGSIPAAISVFIAAKYPGLAFVDLVGAVVVSFFIFQATYKIMRPAIAKLVDSSATKEEINKIRDAVLKTDGVENIHDIRTRYIGSNSIAADFHIEVDENLSVRDAHKIYEVAKENLTQECNNVVDIVVHIDPCKK